MCDVCNLEGNDWKFTNGKHGNLVRSRLYSIYEGKVAHLQLCLLHDIELFMLGESRFLKEHIGLAQQLAMDKQKFAAKL